MATKLNIPDHQEEAVWVRTWCAVASSVGCKTRDIATNWADACLYDFKVRFRKTDCAPGASAGGKINPA